jgi:hypothetical protein
MKNILRMAVAGAVIILSSVVNANAQEPVSPRKMKNAQHIAYSTPMKGKNTSLDKRSDRSKANGVKPPKPGAAAKNFSKGKNPDANSRKMKKRAKGQK